MAAAYRLLDHNYILVGKMSFSDQWALLYYLTQSVREITIVFIV